MNWNAIYQDMVFTPDKDEHARRMVIRDAVLALDNFVRGQAASYEAKDALGILEGEFGTDMIKFTAQIRECLRFEEQDAREACMYPQISNIKSHIRKVGCGHYLSC